MKKFSILAIAAALLMGVTSCNKDNGEGSEPQGEGSVKLSLGFLKVGETKALSTAMPTTSWTENIKDMQLILVDPTSNLVKTVRPITVPAANPAGGNFLSTFTGIPAGMYDLYVVANVEQTAGPAFYDESATSKTMTFAAGDNFSAKLYELKEKGSWTTPSEVAGSVGYTSPAEIFIGKQAAVQIVQDTPTPSTVTLTRAVSLLRVRLDVSNANYAATVDFTHALSGIRLRRHATALNLRTGATTLAATPVDGVYFSDKAFKTATDYNNKVTAGNYAPSQNMTDANYTHWNDYLILPGGGTTATANEFNIAIAGWAPEGYVKSDGTTVPAGGQLVWWQGAVKAAVGANNILDVSVKFNTPGTGGPDVPPVVNFGSLDITVSLAPWAAINGLEIEL